MTINFDYFHARRRKGGRKKIAHCGQAVYGSEKEYLRPIEEHAGMLSSLEHVHYASSGYAVMFIFQAMDAAGKDGNIRNVTSGSIPSVAKFSVSSRQAFEELLHDFLWRTTELHGVGGWGPRVGYTRVDCGIQAWGRYHGHQRNPCH
jgi:polyphosphate kinase 2 (PPK2 family)